MTCAFDECSNKFEPHRHNQKYCSSSCCKDATNKRIRDKYSATKQRLNGEIRVCTKCDTILSRYTEDDECSECILKEEKLERLRLKRLFGAV